jgi:chromatin remodeling complex protein RSC6
MSSKAKKNTSAISEENNYEKKYENLLNRLRENYIEQKKLLNDLKELHVLHKKELKLASKNKNKLKNNGICKPQPVPQSLKDLLDIEEDSLSRVEVTKLLYKYIEKNKMCEKSNRRNIIPNKKFIKIFQMNNDDTMTFYNIQSWIKKIYDNELGDDEDQDEYVIDLDDQ